MNWLEKLNAKYGRYGIRGITRYMIFAHLLGYVFYYLEQFAGINISQWLFYSPTLIFRGQVWRLVTWIFVQNGSFSIWDLIFVIFLLRLGDNLEQALGSFRMETYFITGILISDIGGILVYLLLNVDLGMYYSYGYYGLSTYYILFSLYMMLGLFMPDAQVYLYGILPIKMKWMLIVWAIMYGYEIVTAFSSGIQVGFFSCSDMIFAFLNVVIFVYSCKHRLSFRQSAKQAARRQQYRQAVNDGYRENRGNAGAQTAPRTIHPGAGNSIHKCYICGRTEVTNPELTFRYCSKCTGGKEYCSDHLFTHEHN